MAAARRSASPPLLKHMVMAPVSKETMSAPTSQSCLIKVIAFYGSVALTGPAQV